MSEAVIVLLSVSGLQLVAVYLLGWPEPATITLQLVSEVGSLMSTTRATSKMEELMSALLERMEQQNEQLLGKMEQQNEQLQVMTQQQADRIENVAQRQKETDQEVSAIAGELRSVKLTIDGRLDAMEDSVARLAKQIRTTPTEGQVSTKHELRKELLQELSDGTSALCATANSRLSSHQEPSLQ